jgi:DNA processing protein
MVSFVSDPTLQNVHFFLTLLQLRGLGRRTIWKNLKHGKEINNVNEFLSFLPNKHYSIEEINGAKDYASQKIDESRKAKICSYSIWDREYPAHLKSIDDPPLVLHVKGDPSPLNWRNTLAVIGTREPTEFGKKSAHKIAQSVAESGFCVVSGLAIGCDAEAHAGCLDGGGKTIAVLAHGLDKVYPAANKPLAARILEKNGCLVSEYEFGKPAFKTAFIERDRLQSGLSQAVLVIETGLKGGSLHTAGFAKQQKRILACIQHPENLAQTEKALGNAKLIKEGAVALKNSEDVKNLLHEIVLRTGKPEPAINKIENHTQLNMFN